MQDAEEYREKNDGQKCISSSHSHRKSIKKQHSGTQTVTSQNQQTQTFRNGPIVLFYTSLKPIYGKNFSVVKT